MKSIYIVLACSLISLTYNDIVVEESWRGVVSRSVGGTVLCMNINDVSPGRYYR